MRELYDIPETEEQEGVQLMDTIIPPSIPGKPYPMQQTATGYNPVKLTYSDSHYSADQELHIRMESPMMQTHA